MDKSTPSTVLNNTQPTTWHFLIKAPYLGNLVLYMTQKIKDLGIFLVMKIKRIAKIRIAYYR